MKIILPKIENQQINTIAKTTSKMNISEVFSKNYYPYVDRYKLYAAHFNSIPNTINEIKIDCINAHNWFVEEYQSDIRDMHYSMHPSITSVKSEIDNIYYFLYADLMIYFEIDYSIVRVFFRNTDKALVDKIIAGILKFKFVKSKNRPEISLLVQTSSGLDSKIMSITKPKLSISDNYNDDFNEIHKTILKRLSKRNDKGLVLLHGKPGTGKTSYIKYLISLIDKEVIFLPPNLASAITNPDLISLLIDKPNSIFVIEDAENIVIDRANNENSSVSALLNISDGLLSDCLNIQIICSFNTDISKIDTALMRKGRMIASYDFKELEVSKVKALSKKLGFISKHNSPMTLTAIYNQEDQEFQQNRERKSIGFKA